MCVESIGCTVAIEAIYNAVNSINECLNICPDRMLANNEKICKFCHDDCKTCIEPGN